MCPCPPCEPRRIFGHEQSFDANGRQGKLVKLCRGLKGPLEQNQLAEQLLLAERVESASIGVSSTTYERSGQLMLREALLGRRPYLLERRVGSGGSE